MDSDARRRYTVLACVVVAALAALAMDTVGPGRRVDNWLWDRLSPRVSAEVNGTNTIVFGLDDASVAALQPVLGPWPYRRDVWAHVLRYLDAAGASHITLDVLLTDQREGDEQLRETLAGLNNVALAAVALPFQIGADRTLVVPPSRALRVSPDAPARIALDLVGPLPELADQAVMGVATAVPDDDGMVRRLPVLTRIGATSVAGLSFVSLLGDHPSVDAQRTWRGHTLTMGRHVVPVDEQGQVELHYPLRPPALPSLPLADLVRAAITPDAAHDLALQIRNKRIYIGASALLLEEEVRTPMGNLSGVEFLRLGSVLVENDALVRPRTWSFDVTVLLGALVVFLAVRARHHRTRALLFGLLGASAATVALAMAMLLSMQQRVSLQVPLAAVGLTAIMLGLADLARLRRQQVRLEAERVAAERASELKTQFLNHVAHELRTPVTAILGFGRLIVEGRTPAATVEYGRVITRNGAHLLHLVNNLLNDATLSVGRARVAPQPVQIRQLLSDVLATMEGLPRQDGVALSGDVGPDVPESVLIDALRVRQVLLNLLANAMKFTEAGSIHVTVDWHDGTMTLRVSDTGTGMAADVLARVFDEFELGDPRAIRAGGTGLGLSVSRRLARLMGGELVAESAEGRGSCFTLTLPARLVATPSAPDGAGEPVADATDPLRPLVLICDDVDDIRQLFAVVLESAGARVETVSTGADAVTQAMRLRPDAVIMDLDLLDQDGIATVQQLRRQGYDGPVIAISGSGHDRQASLRQHGFTDSASKPISSALLVDLVARHVRGWQPHRPPPGPMA